MACGVTEPGDALGRFSGSGSSAKLTSSSPPLGAAIGWTAMLTPTLRPSRSVCAPPTTARSCCRAAWRVANRSFVRSPSRAMVKRSRLASPVATFR